VPWNSRAQEASESQEQEQEQRDPEALGREICLRLLAMAPRTRAQLGDAMRRRGIPDEAAESVLDRFTDAGLIDDAAFARAWVESRHQGRGLSRRSLSAELRQRGVDDDDISEAVEVVDPDQEVATARRLAERKLAATYGQPHDARVRKVAGMLARKGYPSGLVFRLIREVLEQEGADADLPEDDSSD
jgi:regulatory protein